MPAPPPMSKPALKEELVAVATRDLATLEKAHKETRDGATHAEAKPENDKDTRALEQSYLARGQAMRIEELRTAVVELRAMPIRDFKSGERIALGALVTLEDDDGTERWLFVAPHAGGTKLAGGVQAVTPRSPLGAAIVGRVEGDDVEIVLGGKTRKASISAVR